jgi:hypothetical protein
MVIGVFFGCDSESPNEPPATLTLSPAGPITLEVGQEVRIDATVTNSASSVNFVIRDDNNFPSDDVATIIERGDRHVVVRGVAPGFVGLVATLASASDDDVGDSVDLEVVPSSGPGGALEPGLFPVPVVRDVEAIFGLIASSFGGRRSGGGGGFANLTGDYLAVIAGASGYVVVDLLTREVVQEQVGFLTGPYFGVAAASQAPPGDDSPAALLAFGQTGWVLSPYHDGAFQMATQNTGTTYDAFPAGGRVEADVIPFVQPGVGVKFVQYDAGQGRYAATTEVLAVDASAGELVSAYLHDDDTETPAPILILARGVTSNLLLHRRDGSAPEALALGLDARRVRCAGVTSGLLCGVTLFGDDAVALVRWDGEALPTLAGEADAGDGPVDLDLHVLPSGNVALVTTGFNNNTITEIEVRPNGSVASNQTRAAPAGCLNPGHAIYVEDAEGLKVVGTCYTSDNYFIEGSRF